MLTYLIYLNEIEDTVEVSREDFFRVLFELRVMAKVHRVEELKAGWILYIES